MKNKNPPNVERITLELANKIQDAIDTDALSWMSDKGYKVSSLEDPEFKKIQERHHALWNKDAEL